ncbi:MAG: hypothetical protein QNJ20_18075 [Paracoccaceae bacterium]|nr:hypothetical protein [Paracoccaceae bacterium]
MVQASRFERLSFDPFPLFYNGFVLSEQPDPSFRLGIVTFKAGASKAIEHDLGPASFTVSKVYGAVSRLAENSGAEETEKMARTAIKEWRHRAIH